MDRIIVFGLGNMYRLYKEKIESEYEIVGVSDNCIVPEKTGKSFISPDSISAYSDVKVMICVRNGYLDIFRQMIKCGFQRENIISVDRYYQKDVIDTWTSNGCPIPPPAEYKRYLIKEYAKKYGCNQLIETGTYYGDTVESQLINFSSISSIELSSELYNKAVKKFKGIQSVHLYCGDSGDMLGSVIDSIDARDGILFWLDGHYSGGETACGEEETPIIRELSVISDKCDSGVILIDDARCFVGRNGYPTATELKEYMLDRFRILEWDNSADIIRCVF